MNWENFPFEFITDCFDLPLQKDVQTVQQSDTSTEAGSIVQTDTWELNFKTTTDGPGYGSVAIPQVRCDCSYAWYYYLLIFIFYVISLFISGAGTIYFRRKHEAVLAMLMLLLRLLRRASVKLEAAAVPAQANAQDAAGKTFFIFCFFI